jgi:hypothetical protein
MKYHSALSKDIDNLDSTPLYYSKWGVAFQQDVTEDMPDEYDKCDVMYSEISWTQGVKKFNERAGVNKSYKEYIDGINDIIDNYYLTPIFIVAGKKEAKLLEPTDMQIRSKLNGAPCVIYCYHISPDMFTHVGSLLDVQADCKELIIELADIFNCIGDFCCGYGRTGAIFSSFDKRFVMSDYNGKCITYIKNYYESIQEE